MQLDRVLSFDTIGPRELGRERALADAHEDMLLGTQRLHDLDRPLDGPAGLACRQPTDVSMDAPTLRARSGAPLGAPTHSPRSKRAPHRIAQQGPPVIPSRGLTSEQRIASPGSEVNATTALGSSWRRLRVLLRRLSPALARQATTAFATAACAAFSPALGDSWLAMTEFSGACTEEETDG